MKYMKSPKQARSTILSLCTALISLLIHGITAPAYGQWEKCVIDNSLSQPEILSVDDLNNDGVPDVLLGDIAQDKIFWYENNNPKWIKHTIEESLDGAYHVRVGDLNGDGMLDVAASGYHAKLLVWYENHDPVWTRHIINSTQGNAGCVKIFDVDDDDTLDVVLAIYDNSYPERDFAWYENNHPTWTKHVISTDFAVGDFVFGDIDGDGMMDVAASRWLERQVVWFKNENGGLSWTKHFIDKNSDSGVLSLSDINGDDKIDVVITTYTDNTVVWYENNDTSWIPHMIDENLTSPHSVVALDIDVDNKPDVVVTGKGTNDVLWYRNNHPVWEKYIIDPNLAGPHRIAYADIDGDSTLDIIVPGRDAGNIVWYKNPHGTLHAQTLKVSPFSIQSQTDTLKVRAKVSNPENHPGQVYAVIQGDQTQYMDTLQLYDDGMHSDDDPSDNIWGNKRITTDLPEDEFEVDLFTYDSTYGDTLGFVTPARFITFGPVEFAGYSNPSGIPCNKTTPEPGGCLNLKVTLKNNSSVATATNVTAEVVSLDTLISLTIGSSDFQDIPAGESSESNRYLLSISEEWQEKADIQFAVNISSYGIVCWRDTFYIPGSTNVDDLRASMIRIYPNPANNILTVESNTSNHLEIEINNLNGQLLYSNIIDEPTYQIDLSSFQKGVYLITVKSKDFVRTERFIKI